MSDLLAEAEYIFNNADEFLGGIEEESYALAAWKPNGNPLNPFWIAGVLMIC